MPRSVMILRPSIDRGPDRAFVHRLELAERAEEVGEGGSTRRSIAAVEHPPEEVPRRRLGEEIVSMKRALHVTPSALHTEPGGQTLHAGAELTRAHAGQHRQVARAAAGPAEHRTGVRTVSEALRGNERQAEQQQASSAEDQRAHRVAPTIAKAGGEAAVMGRGPSRLLR